MSQKGLAAIDFLYGALRGAALFAGLVYAYLAPGVQGKEPVLAFAVFAGYGAAFYALGYRALVTGHKPQFYAVLGAADLVFTIVLMHMTGGEQSPFYRALYLWVAMPAFYFGMRTGTLASGVAFAVYLWFFSAQKPVPIFNLLVTAFGLLLHGPVIGFLVDRDRALQRELASLRAQPAAERQAPAASPGPAE